MIKIQIQDAEIFQLIKQIQALGDDMAPVMKIIAGYMKESVNLNFDAEGRPRWPALAEATIVSRTRAGHWPGKMLVSGAQGGLKASISQRSTSTQAIVGSNKSYAAIRWAEKSPLIVALKGGFFVVIKWCFKNYLNAEIACRTGP